MREENGALLRAYFERALSEEEGDALRRWLEADASHQERFVREALFEHQLRVAAAAKVEESSLESFGGAASATCPRPTSAVWEESLDQERAVKTGWMRRMGRAMLPLAAGVVIGALCSSMVRAYAGGRSEVTELDLPLVDRDFEDGRFPSEEGPPQRCGVWAGDYATVVCGENGITPHRGKHMLRFLRSDSARSPKNESSHVADIFQIVDLRAHKAFLAELKNPIVTLRARFQGISQEGYRYSYGCLVYARQGEPGEFGMRWPVPLSELPAVGGNHVEDDGAAGWKTVTTECAIPAGVDYLVVHLKAMQMRPVNTEGSVAFLGQYVDDVQLVLRTESRDAGVPRFNLRNLLARRPVPRIQSLSLGAELDRGQPASASEKVP
jgi:hypothetical protein